MGTLSETEKRPAYDLTCWYLNVRRVLELVGTRSIAADLQRLETLADLKDEFRKNLLLVALKNFHDDVAAGLQSTNLRKVSSRGKPEARSIIYAL